jgi:hypothetical protein
MDQLFINTYIEKMANRLGENVKSEILLQTQLELAQQLVTQLQKENEELQAQLEKINKKKKPEVDTSTF